MQVTSTSLLGATSETKPQFYVKVSGRTTAGALLLCLAYKDSWLHWELECSLWIRPSKFFGLEPKWRWPFWNAEMTLQTLSCFHPMWWGVVGIVGVDILQTSTLPFSPTDHHAKLHESRSPSQKERILTAYNIFP